MEFSGIGKQSNYNRSKLDIFSKPDNKLILEYEKRAQLGDIVNTIDCLVDVEEVLILLKLVNIKSISTFNNLF